MDDDSIKSSSESEKGPLIKKSTISKNLKINKQEEKNDNLKLIKNENKSNEDLADHFVTKSVSNELIEQIYLEILDQVINSDYESPSIPEAILCVFKELFSDS